MELGLRGAADPVTWWQAPDDGLTVGERLSSHVQRSRALIFSPVKQHEADTCAELSLLVREGLRELRLDAEPLTGAPAVAQLV